MKKNLLLETSKVKKRVTFSYEAEGASQVTSYQKGKKSRNFTIIKDQILHYLNTGEYSALIEYLNCYSPQNIREFFSAKGEIIFSWAINYCSHSEAIEFLINNVPTDIIEKILSADNFSILTCFLLSQNLLDQQGHYSQEKKETTIQKINHLLKLKNNSINNVIAECLNKESFTSTIKLGFSAAKLRT